MLFLEGQSDSDTDEEGSPIAEDDTFSNWLSTEDHLSQTQWQPLKMMDENVADVGEIQSSSNLDGGLNKPAEDQPERVVMYSDVQQYLCPLSLQAQVQDYRLEFTSNTFFFRVLILPFHV